MSLDLSRDVLGVAEDLKKWEFGPCGPESGLRVKDDP